MSKIYEKEVFSIKEEFISGWIDHICNGEDNLSQILNFIRRVSFNSVSIKLFALFLQALAAEDYKSAHDLKQEVIQFIDIVDN